MAMLANLPVRCIKRFWNAEDGAITVDWVVMTAAVCGLAMWLFTVIIEEQFVAVGEKVNEDIQEASSRD